MISAASTSAASSPRRAYDRDAGKVFLTVIQKDGTFKAIDKL
ncbi:hypothetical protein QWJ07_13905 [Frankia sp. RB7]|nr:hypothetical protein [Frankia sp. RB7]